MKFSNFLPGIGWLIVSTVLLSLPGNDLPHSRLFDIPFFDKYVHLGMFFLLAAFFCIPFQRSALPLRRIKAAHIAIALYALAFGIAMEFVQKYLVAGRSFDVIDILFDSFGSATAPSSCGTGTKR